MPEQGGGYSPVVLAWPGLVWSGWWCPDRGRGPGFGFGPHKNKCKCNLKTTLGSRVGVGVGVVGRLAGSGAPLGLNGIW